MAMAEDHWLDRPALGGLLSIVLVDFMKLVVGISAFVIAVVQPMP
jgi:hypothetical protein